MQYSRGFTQHPSLVWASRQYDHVLIGILVALVLCCAIVGLLMLHTGIGFDFLDPGNLARLLVIAGCALVRYRLRYTVEGKLKPVRDFAEYAGLFAAIAIMGATASYPIGAISQGFADAELARIDAMLRFNWLDWYQLVAAHPVLQTAGRLAYANIYFSPVLLFASFAWSGDRKGAQIMLISFGLAAILTLTLFTTMPAVGPLSYLWQGPIPYMPISGTFQADLLPALRDETMGSVYLADLQGLVCAPSFHAASAVIYIAAGWSNRAVRWPVGLLNAAMLLATPVEGTHYLADIIAGAIVACAALSATRFAMAAYQPRQRLHQARPIPAS